MGECPVDGTPEACDKTGSGGPNIAFHAFLVVGQGDLGRRTVAGSRSICSGGGGGDASSFSLG